MLKFKGNEASVNRQQPKPAPTRKKHESMDALPSSSSTTSGASGVTSASPAAAASAGSNATATGTPSAPPAAAKMVQLTPSDVKKLMDAALRMQRANQTGHPKYAQIVSLLRQYHQQRQEQQQGGGVAAATATANNGAGGSATTTTPHQAPAQPAAQVPGGEFGRWLLKMCGLCRSVESYLLLCTV